MLFLHYFAPILAFSTATLQLSGIFPHISHISDIPFQHKHIFPTHFSNTLFCKRRRGAFAPLSICLLFLPTHSSHLLLYPFTDTPQEVFQHIHSIDGKLPHEIICFFQFRFERPVLDFQFLILSLQALILVFKVQHLFKVCPLPLTGISTFKIFDEIFRKFCLLHRFVRILSDTLKLLLLLPDLTLFIRQVLLHFIQLIAFIRQIL